MPASSDSEFLSALRRSPADKCAYPSASSSAMSEHWVPFPDPGPPRTNTTRIGFDDAVEVARSSDERFDRLRRSAMKAAALKTTPVASAAANTADLRLCPSCIGVVPRM